MRQQLNNKSNQGSSIGQRIYRVLKIDRCLYKMSTVVDPGGPGIEPLFYDQYFERAHMDGTTH